MYYDLTQSRGRKTKLRVQARLRELGRRRGKGNREGSWEEGSREKMNEGEAVVGGG